MMFTIIVLTGIVMVCLAFFKASKSLLAKAFWIILLIILLGIFLFPS